MSKPADLNRCLAPLDQDHTIIAVIEMSQSSWLVAGVVPGIARHPLKKLAPAQAALLKPPPRWREEAGQAGRAITRIAVAFEAGRDGFWLARWLRAHGIEAHVIHPTSVAVSRESGSGLHGIKCSDSRVLGVKAVEFIMTAPLSQDLRERIVRAVESGSSIRQAARRFAVSASAAIKLMQRVRRTGSTAPAKIGGARRPLLEAHADALRAIVLRQTGITLREIKATLAARGIVVKALSTLADMRHRLDPSHKKRACERPSRIA